jgi:hypothetical protein
MNTTTLTTEEKLAARKAARAKLAARTAGTGKPFAAGANVAAVEAAKVAAVPAPKKKVAAPTLNTASETGKVLETANATDLVLTVSFDDGATIRLAPMKYEGRWCWSVPAHAKATVAGNALLHHKAYTQAGGFFALTPNDLTAQAEAVRTRIKSRRPGPNPASKRTEANVTAYQQWAEQVTSAE